MLTVGTISYPLLKDFFGYNPPPPLLNQHLLLFAVRSRISYKKIQSNHVFFIFLNIRIRGISILEAESSALPPIALPFLVAVGPAGFGRPSHVVSWSEDFGKRRESGPLPKQLSSTR